MVNPPKSTEKLEYEISMADSYFLNRVLGSRYLNFPPQVNKKTMRETLLRLVKYLNEVIRNLDFSDQFHKEEVFLSLENIKRSIGSFDECSPLKFFELVFLILGEVPQNTSKKRPSKRDDFLLTSYRRISYTQNLIQKVKLIIDSSKRHPFTQICKEDLFDLFVSKFQSDPEEFLAWFKKKYPQIYLKLF